MSMPFYDTFLNSLAEELATLIASSVRNVDFSKYGKNSLVQKISDKFDDKYSLSRRTKKLRKCRIHLHNICKRNTNNIRSGVADLIEKRKSTVPEDIQQIDIFSENKETSKGEEKIFTVNKHVEIPKSTFEETEAVTVAGITEKQFLFNDEKEIISTIPREKDKTRFVLLQRVAFNFEINIFMNSGERHAFLRKELPKYSISCLLSLMDRDAARRMNRISLTMQYVNILTVDCTDLITA